MAVDLPEKIRTALEEPQFWHLATVNPDGSPQVTTMWVSTRDGKILLNTALGRKKPRNLERDGRIAMSWSDPQNGYHSASIQGRVVGSYTGEQAEQDIDDLAQKYIGQSPYPWRSPGEQRITYLVEPTHVYHQDP